MTAPSMVNGKFRRPVGMRGRDEVPAFDPRLDPHPDGGTMGSVAFFEYQEDAVKAAIDYVEPQGYQWRVQYMGRYDLWLLTARRKSWSSGKELLVEACLNPDAVVLRHAHVPYRFRYQEGM